MVVVGIAALSGLIYAEKINVDDISYNISNIAKVEKLESELSQIQSKIDVLMGETPKPVHSNQIIIPDKSDVLDYCKDWGCVTPHIIEIGVGESITWINESDENLQIYNTSIDKVYGCGGLAPYFDMFHLTSKNMREGYSQTIEFNDIGEYRWCDLNNINHYNGIIIVKERGLI